MDDDGKRRRNTPTTLLPERSPPSRATAGYLIVSRWCDLLRRLFGVEFRLLGVGIKCLCLCVSILFGDDLFPVNVHVDVVAHGNSYHVLNK